MEMENMRNEETMLAVEQQAGSSVAEAVDTLAEPALEAVSSIVEGAAKAVKKATKRTRKTAAKAADTTTKAAKKAAKKAEKAVEEVVEDTAKAVKKSPALLKPEVMIQWDGKEVNQTAIVDAAKAEFKAAMGRTAIKSLSVYVKPQENAAYYVINGDYTGKIDL